MVWWIIFDCILDILGIILWDSRSYLIILSRQSCSGIGNNSCVLSTYKIGLVVFLLNYKSSLYILNIQVLYMDIWLTNIFCQSIAFHYLVMFFWNAKVLNIDDVGFINLLWIMLLGSYLRNLSLIKVLKISSCFF